MELEFDKEMDAILRRSGPDALRGVLVGDKPLDKPKHLDADAIAAFVENAIPTPTRRLYMEHFADCDRCRKLLSTSILMNESAATAAAPAAAVVAAGESLPWYQRIFRTPNMALAMGALVLTFSGILGYLVLQNREGANATISQISTDEITKGGPSASSESPATNSNATANVVANTVTSAANTSIEVGDVSPSTKTVSGPSPETGKNAGIVGGRAEADKEIAAAAPAGEPKLIVAAPPPAPTDDRLKAGSTSRVTADGVERKDEDLALNPKKKVAEESRDNRRDLPPSPAKAGPTRSAGPIQNTQSNQIQNRVFDMPVTRVVGGKTFDNRSGAWYDRAYKNQQTNNYRRGTDQYKKLDSGLRSIADNLGGTVVMMWKDKAYRIQ